MMNGIKNFIKTENCAVIWTAVYFVALYFIFLVIWEFNMLSIAHWARLPNVRLHGLPGFSFGMLLMAAIPVYAATLIYTLRKKKTIIPLPFCKDKKPVKKPEDAPPPPPEKESQIKIKHGMPREMQEPYLRMAKNGNGAKSSAYKLPDMIALAEKSSDVPPAPTAPKPEYKLPPKDKTPEENTEHFPTPLQELSRDDNANPNFPIPTDFDSDIEELQSAPKFKEISFGGIAKTEKKKSGGDIIKELTSQGYKTETKGDIIIARKDDATPIAIATHDDSDFWIADGDDWFATGKQKQSPIKMLAEFASANDATPILFLKESNIMDIETRRQEWEKSGIRVISDIGDL